MLAGQFQNVESFLSPAVKKRPKAVMDNHVSSTICTSEGCFKNTPTNIDRMHHIKESQVLKCFKSEH